MSDPWCDFKSVQQLENAINYYRASVVGECNLFMVVEHKGLLLPRMYTITFERPDFGYADQHSVSLRLNCHSNAPLRYFFFKMDRRDS